MEPSSEQKVVDNLLCACNGLRCSGICRKINLYRKRKNQNICPSAYKKGSEYKKPTEKKEKQIRNKKWRRQHDEQIR